MKLIFCILCLYLAMPWPAIAADMTGVVRMVDGDTFDLDVWRVRLHGVDAPEIRQMCVRDSGRWPCGREAMRALAKLTNGQTVRCSETGRTRLGQVIAICSVGSLEINAWMVSHGWAVTRDDSGASYIAEEYDAATAGAGIWSGRFIMPERWLRGDRLGE